MSKPAAKKKGGARPGAGRPPSDSERIWCHISRSTRVKLERFAKANGIARKNTSSYWAKIFDSLAGKVDMSEPEYLLLAQSITVREV